MSLKGLLYPKSLCMEKQQKLQTTLSHDSLRCKLHSITFPMPRHIYQMYVNGSTSSKYLGLVVVNYHYLEACFISIWVMQNGDYLVETKPTDKKNIPNRAQGKCGRHWHIYKVNLCLGLTQQLIESENFEIIKITQLWLNIWPFELSQITLIISQCCPAISQKITQLPIKYIFKTVFKVSPFCIRLKLRGFSNHNFC